MPDDADHEPAGRMNGHAHCERCGQPALPPDEPYTVDGLLNRYAEMLGEKVAEVERLREALRRIADNPEMSVQALQDLADEALYPGVERGRRDA